MCKRLCSLVTNLIALIALTSSLCAQIADGACYPGLACNLVSTGRSTQSELVRSFWTHNGSLVYLTWDGDKRNFYYENPREGMQAVGAERGTLLFEGKRRGSNYIGIAFIFTEKCGAVPYAVRGVVTNDDRTIIMLGRAPRRLNEQCRVVSYKDDKLIFNLAQ